MKTPQQYAEKIDEQIAYLYNEASKLDEETIRWKPSEDEWSIMQVLCHVEEFPLYFTDELQKVLSGEAEKWGRGLDDPDRLKAVETVDERSVDEALKGVDATRATVKERLQNLSEDDLKVEQDHRNPKFGTKPMDFLVHHFLEEHLDKHHNQFRRVLSQYEEAKK